MTIVANNRKARFEYFIQDVMEVGIELLGTEVKSLRSGKVSIKEAFAENRNGELWLINSKISAYENAAKVTNVNPIRERKLLVHKKELSKLTGKIKREGMTLIPLKLYFNKKGRAKIELAIAKGKKLYDKREDKKKKDWNIQRNRLLKN